MWLIRRTIGRTQLTFALTDQYHLNAGESRCIFNPATKDSLIYALSTDLYSYREEKYTDEFTHKNTAYRSGCVISTFASS